MNKLIVMCRLTKDPEVRYSQSTEGLVIARISIAVDRKYKRDGEPTADFFNCVAFGKQAEFIEKYLKKGTKVLLSGRVENNNYTKDNGDKVYSTQIMVEEIEFAESKGSSTTGEQPPTQSNEPQFNADGFINIPTGLEEELPFA